MLKCEKRNTLCVLLHSGVNEANNDLIFQMQQERIWGIRTIKKLYMLMNAYNPCVNQKQNLEMEPFSGCRGEWKSMPVRGTNPLKRLSSQNKCGWSLKVTWRNSLEGWTNGIWDLWWKRCVHKILKQYFQGVLNWVWWCTIPLLSQHSGSRGMRIRNSRLSSDT